MPGEWDPQRFSAIFTEILDQTGMARVDLAAKAGISPSQVTRWASGQHRPSYDHVRRLAMYLTARFSKLGGLPAELVRAAGYDGGSDTLRLPEADPELQALMDEMRVRVDRIVADFAEVQEMMTRFASRSSQPGDGEQRKHGT